MNKQDLIDVISAETKTTKLLVGEVLDLFYSHVERAVGRGEQVRLNGFGTFSKAATSARLVRNPKTKEPIQLPASFKPKFSPGKSFKHRVLG